MKPMQVPKRLPYSFSTARPRSNSANSRSFYTQPTGSPLAFFDAPPVAHTPSPGSRPTTIGSSLRLVQPKPEAETSQQSHNHSHGYAPPLFSAVLSSSPHSHSQNIGNYPQVFPYLPYPQPTHLAPAAATDAQLAEVPFDVNRPRYQLDVGAYGIPKNHKSSTSSRDFLHRRSGPSVCEDATLATQVGEDAYFVTENAMGVADGVGGWKNRSGAVTRPNKTPSALFASRLMHYCSDEVSNYHHSPATSSPTSEMEDLIFDGMESEDLYSELEDSLSDLEEGIDVLMILENAYDRAIKAHVVNPVPEQSVTTTPAISNGANTQSSSRASSRPLKAGSSTALLAVLEQPTARNVGTRAKRSSSSPPNHRSRSASRCRPEPAVEDHAPITAGFGSVQSSSAGSSRASTTQRDAVIKIANLGDSMAMLVRGRDIVWRSEEMWWSFNTPVQLGPVSPSKPTDAQVFEIPVVANDILILASDGLSDNLWDEEVLEEVVRVKDVLLKHSTLDGASLGQLLARRSLPALLSEALCSRARRVAERGPSGSGRRGALEVVGEEIDEVPFARRAREEGRRFKGGKVDDISVLVAVVSSSTDPLSARIS
ncbi:phosphatase 2C-like domain-containing protein [Thelephora terrestris]|uniref:Protein phosphatase n=1 Tax=Thelephora terrestris TaxID=56493 RepID=A0A9P6L5D5_9AGAM|nr:phosphatase 2C-like domain-containing protein [Thelephora terrestris]